MFFPVKHPRWAGSATYVALSDSLYWVYLQADDVVLSRMDGSTPTEVARYTTNVGAADEWLACDDSSGIYVFLNGKAGDEAIRFDTATGAFSQFWKGDVPVGVVWRVHYMSARRSLVVVGQTGCFELLPEHGSRKIAPLLPEDRNTIYVSSAVDGDSLALNTNKGLKVYGPDSATMWLWRAGPEGWIRQLASAGEGWLAVVARSGDRNFTAAWFPPGKGAIRAVDLTAGRYWRVTGCGTWAVFWPDRDCDQLVIAKGHGFRRLSLPGTTRAPLVPTGCSSQNVFIVEDAGYWRAPVTAAREEIPWYTLRPPE